MPTFPFPRRFLAFALTTLAALVSAFALMGCTSEKQYPGGDNDDRRKAPAASPSPAASASPHRRDIA